MGSHYRVFYVQHYAISDTPYISKNKTDSDYKLYYICYQQPMSAKNANNICLFQKSKLSK